MKLLIDTNILIDYLNGVEPARRVVEDNGPHAISPITWIEVMVGAHGDEEACVLEAWLARFSLIELDLAVARTAATLRRRHRIRLPDALLWAVAEVHQLILATRNTRDFPAGQPGIHVPYRL